MIPDDVIETVREAADLVGIIGEHVELRRTGADYRGPCPFHGGTHRNFAVIPKKGMFYCFVCHEAGDVYTFFMKKLGMDYPTAVREVARRVGITIPERSGPTGPDPREPLYAAVATAADWFARQLRDSPEADIARKYLESRHVTMEQAQVQGLGYAPRGTAFLDAMKSLGVRQEVLLDAGLIVKRDDGSQTPRFRGRLLFPIHDLRSRVVAFSGRVLGEGEPKYLNSPETPVFHKGQLLYNLHLAKHGMRKAERAILVEGQFDVLRLTLAGLEEIVAPLGTGLTDEQAALLQRHTPHVILLYDSDDPGLRATFRAGDVLLRHKVRVSVATLPEGEDPDTLVQNKGVAALERVMKDAVDIMERKIQILGRKGFFASIQGKRRALDGLLPTIRATADPVTKDFYITQVANATGIKNDALVRELQDTLRVDSDGLTGPASAPIQIPQGKERLFVLLAMEGSPWRERVLEVIQPERITFPPFREILEAVANGKTDDLDGIAARTYEALRNHGLSPFTPEQIYEDLSKTPDVARLQSELWALDRQIPLAQGAEQEKLIMRKQELWNELRTVEPRYKIAGRRKGAPGS